METPQLIAILVGIVVLFFGWQWVSRAWSAKKPVAAREQPPAPAPAAPPAPAPPAAPPAPAPAPAAPASIPDVPGQTPSDLSRVAPHEPLREDNLRHPENLFHGPGAADSLGAQNDGPQFGSVFAFDGQEPTRLAPLDA